MWRLLHENVCWQMPNMMKPTWLHIIIPSVSWLNFAFRSHVGLTARHTLTTNQIHGYPPAQHCLDHVWERAPRQRVAAAILRPYSFGLHLAIRQTPGPSCPAHLPQICRPLSGHSPGRRQSRHAHLHEISLRLGTDQPDASATMAVFLHLKQPRATPAAWPTMVDPDRIDPMGWAPPHAKLHYPIRHLG